MAYQKDNEILDQIRDLVLSHYQATGVLVSSTSIDFIKTMDGQKIITNVSVTTEK